MGKTRMFTIRFKAVDGENTQRYIDLGGAKRLRAATVDILGYTYSIFAHLNYRIKNSGDVYAILLDSGMMRGSYSSLNHKLTWQGDLPVSSDFPSELGVSAFNFTGSDITLELRYIVEE